MNHLEPSPEWAHQDDEGDADEDRGKVRNVGSALGAHVANAMLGPT